MTKTNRIDLDILVLALAAIGRGNVRDVELEYVRQVGHDGVDPVDITHALIDLVDAKRARKNSTRNGTVRFEIMPTVGMAATVCGYSDRHAATVIAVSPSGHKVTVQHDLSVRTDKNGMSETQTYTYERDPNGKRETFYRHGDGRYGRNLVLGVRRSYHDYSF